MSSHGKLTIRPLPHLDFILGWPGIPGSSQRSRNDAHIAGNVEIRLGSKGMKAQWLRIELRKIETVPGGENWGELIGRGPIDVWSARPGEGNGDRETDADGTSWELLKTADFPFRINIPEALPPSAKLDKLCGVQYEVVSSLCVKTKKGLLRKEDTSSIIQTVQPITLEKHELHSTWPAYNQPDTHTGERDQMRAKLRRDRYCFAPGDKIRVKVIVSSNRVEPAKLKSVAVTIKETVTFHGVKPNKKSITSNNASAQPSMQRVDVVTQKAKQIGKKLYKGDSKDYDLELTIPKSHALMTISTAKHIEVSYTMRVYCDIAKAPIIIDHIPMMMTTFPRQQSLATIKKIGFVDGLSEREMVIDDDVDDASTTHGVSRSVRPIPSRSLSYSGSTSTASGYDHNGMLQRKDTVMTHTTGGFAGRGVPGMLFNYPPYGSPVASPAPFGDSHLRPAFAGPIDEETALSSMERSALYHHSNNPTNAAAAGFNYADIASLEPTRSGFTPMRDPSPNQRASFAGFPSSVSTPLSQLTSAQEAEEEKERLYRRARMQAERNQRRADEQRTALAAATASHATNGSTLRRPMSVDGTSTLPASEQEKLRLWERARREAESYQRNFSEGASFPEDDDRSTLPSMASSRIQTPALPRVDEGEPLQNPHGDPARRSSAAFWLDDQREQPAASVIQTSQRPTAAVGPVVATTYPSYQTAEEEKSRLYEQAKAQADIQQNSRLSYQPHLSSPLTPSTSNNSNVSASSPQVAQPSASGSNSALHEKEQMKRYYEAQNAVHQYQNRVDSSEAGASSAGASEMTATPSRSIDPATTTVNGTQALSEKEQMARYHAAQAEVYRHQVAQAAPSSSSSSLQQQQQQQSAHVSSAHAMQQAKSAEVSEKEQQARYQAAQEQVQRYREHQQVAGTSAASASQHQKTASSSSMAPPYTEAPPSAAEHSSAQQQQAPPALSEKEQMRKYWEARDREGVTSTSSSSNVQMNASPTMVSPRPMYAPNFHAMPSTPGASEKPATSPLPQGAFPPAYAAASGSTTTQQHHQSTSSPVVPPPVPKQRVVSYTPQTQFSQQRPPHAAAQQHQRPPNSPPLGHPSYVGGGLPPLQQLSLSTRGGTPNPFEGPWAPKVAAPLWSDDGVHSARNSAPNAPPPLPPKTAIQK